MCRPASYLVVTLVVLMLASQSLAVQGAKNIILMVVDGGGFNHFITTSYYQYGGLGHQVYDGPGWVKYGCTTFDSSGSYSPASMWASFTYQQNGATDSAAAATALNTGVKTYDGAINVDNSYNPLTSIAQVEDSRGRAAGVVTTVEMSHATPACVWAHNTDRGNYAAIANEMIYSSGLDVIMGAGNPNYDNDGLPASMTSDYVGGATTWSQLKNGATGRGWTLIESKAGFQSYAADPNLPLIRLIGIAQVHRTLQEKRTTVSLNTNVPDLATMSISAINILSKDPDGFYLMIEGGAVDYASHDKKLDRMLEEFTDFNRAVEAVVDWIETNSSWNQTLLIVTADHECGCLWGPGSGGTVFNPIVNNGVGVLPGGVYFKNSHTNQLVPLHAKGVGSELFAAYADLTDVTAASKYGFSGKYLDNTDIFKVMYAVATAPYVCSTPLVSDIDDDCRVDFTDYAFAAAAWGQVPPSVDLIIDGVLDLKDVAQFASDWLRCTRLPPESCGSPPGSPPAPLTPE